MVMEHSIELGPRIQEELVRARCRELNPENVDEFVSVVLPFLGGSRETFDAWKPRLRDTTLGDMAMSTVLLKLVVHERTVPAMTVEESGSADLLKLCLALQGCKWRRGHSQSQCSCDRVHEGDP